jgi:hypothetical protein
MTKEDEIIKEFYSSLFSLKAYNKMHKFGFDDDLLTHAMAREIIRLRKAVSQDDKRRK